MSGSHRRTPHIRLGRWSLPRPTLLSVLTVASLALSACMACYTQAAADEPPASPHGHVREQRDQHRDRASIDRSRLIERGTP